MDYIKVILNAPAKYEKTDNVFTVFLNDSKIYKEIALYRLDMTYEFDNITGDDAKFNFVYTKALPIATQNFTIPEGYYKDDMGDLTRELNSSILTRMSKFTQIPVDWMPVKLEFNPVTFKINLTLGANLIFTMSKHLATYLGFNSTRFTNPFQAPFVITAENKFISPELLSVGCNWVPKQASNTEELSVIYNQDVRLLEYGNRIDFKTESPIWFPVTVSQYNKMDITFYINREKVDVKGTVVLEFLTR